MNKHTLSVLVANHSGVLSRVAGLFSRRGYNIDSLTVGETHDPKVSRMTIVARGDDRTIEQIIKQLNKLVDVIHTFELEKEKSVLRELALIKVNTMNQNRASIVEITGIFRANIVDVANESLTVELTGAQNKITAFINLMKPFGIKELVRTGLTAVERGNHEINERINQWEEE